MALVTLDLTSAHFASYLYHFGASLSHVAAKKNAGPASDIPINILQAEILERSLKEIW